MPVAVEVFPHNRPGYGEQSAVRLLRGLAAAAAALRHPNVVGVLNLGRREDCDFVVKELLDGGTVRGLLDSRGALAPAESLAIVEDVLGGLAAAHELGMTHGDVRPETILLDYDGTAKLSEPCRPLEPEDLSELAPTGKGEASGPRFYVAPERAGGAAPGDIRSDLYSLGVTLLEMLSGRAPFRGASPEQAAEAPPDLRELPPDLPEELGAYVGWLTSPAPAHRPSDPAEALSKLRELGLELSRQQKLRRLPAAMSPGQRERRWWARATFWTAVGVLLVMLALIPPIRMIFKGMVPAPVQRRRVDDPARMRRVLTVLRPSETSPPLPGDVRMALMAACAHLLANRPRLAPVDPFMTDELLRAAGNLDDLLLRTDPDYLLKITHSPGLDRLNLSIELTTLRGDARTVRAQCATDARGDGAATALTAALEDLLARAATALGDDRLAPPQDAAAGGEHHDGATWRHLGAALAAERDGRWDEALQALKQAGEAGSHPPEIEVLGAFCSLAAAWEEGVEPEVPQGLGGSGLSGETALLARAVDAVLLGERGAARGALGDYLAAYPDATRGHYLLGLWRTTSGEIPEEAAAALWRALETDPGYLPAARAAARLAAARGAAPLAEVTDRYRRIAPDGEKADKLEAYSKGLSGAM